MFACGCSGRNLNLNLNLKLLKICSEEPVLESLYCKVAACKQLIKKPKERLLGQLYQKRDAYTQTFTQVLSINFEKKYEHVF